MERKKTKNSKLGKGVLTVGVITGFAGALMLYSQEGQTETENKPVYEHIQIQRIGFKPVQSIEHWNDLKDVALRCPSIRAITEATSCETGCYLYQGVRIEMMGSDSECFGLWKGDGELTLKNSGEKVTFSKAKVMVTPSDKSVTLFDSLGETKLQIHAQQKAAWNEIFTLSEEMTEFIAANQLRENLNGPYRYIIYPDGEAIAFEDGLSLYRFKKPFVGLETLVERITKGKNNTWERSKTNQHENTSYAWGEMSFNSKKSPGKESVSIFKYSSDLRENLEEQKDVQYDISLGFKEKTNEELTRSLGVVDGKYHFLKERSIYVDGVLSRSSQTEVVSDRSMRQSSMKQGASFHEPSKGSALKGKISAGTVKQANFNDFSKIQERAEEISDGAGGRIETIYKDGVLYTKTRLGQHGDKIEEKYDQTGAIIQTAYEDSKGNKEITKILPDKKLISQFKMINGEYKLIDNVEETEQDGYVVMRKLGETNTIALWRSKDSNKVFRSVITSLKEGQYRNVIMPVETQTFGENKALAPSVEVLGSLEFVDKYHTIYQFPVISTGRLIRVIEGNNEIFWEYEKSHGESETVTTTMNMDVLRADERILKGGKIKRTIKLSHKEVSIIGDEETVRTKRLSDFPAAKDGDTIWIKNRGSFVEYDYERSNGEHLIVMHDQQSMKPLHASRLVKTTDNEYLRIFNDTYGNMRLKGSRDDLLSLEQPFVIKDRALDEPVHLISKGGLFEYRYKNTKGKEVTFEVRDSEVSQRSSLREWL